MSANVFSLSLPPERLSCAIFNSPHSGADYAGLEWASTLGPLQIRSSEDAFVDLLFAAAPRFGAPLMAACVPRACVDLNRAPEDLDPALIIGASRRFLNPRIAAGLGVIPRVVAEGRPIQEGKIPLAEAQRRIDVFYRPYHARLRALVDETRALFGQAILLDCHSMPHDALVAAPCVRGRRPDVVLGDRFGASCDRWLLEAVSEIFSQAGFAVAQNAPFAGGYITQSYGRPRQGVQALQIEIDRALYMEEDAIVPSEGFDALRDVLRGVVADLCALGPRLAQVAAE